MRNPAGTRSFLEGEVAALEAFDYLTLEPSGNPLHRIEVGLAESGSLEVRVPGRVPVLPPLGDAERKALSEHGFTSVDADDRTQPWIHPVGDAGAAVALCEKVLQEIFDEKPDVALDIAHGSHRAAHEALKRLAAVRERVERVITEVIGEKPTEDEDEDFVLPIGDVQVTVAPRVLTGGPAIVRVFAVTNVGVAVVPELGLFLNRLNFGLMFGRFALDAEHRSIWFDETLLADQLNEEALKFAIQVVASTADEWDDRLKSMFGGLKFRETMNDEEEAEIPRVKPGEGPPAEHHGQYL
jgi:hypothetical protein